MATAAQRMAALQEEARAAYENFQFCRVNRLLQKFCILDLAGFYLDSVAFPARPATRFLLRTATAEPRAASHAPKSTPCASSSRR